MVPYHYYIIFCWYGNIKSFFVCYSNLQEFFLYFHIFFYTYYHIKYCSCHKKLINIKVEKIYLINSFWVKIGKKCHSQKNTVRTKASVTLESATFRPIRILHYLSFVPNQMLRKNGNRGHYSKVGLSSFLLKAPSIGGIPHYPFDSTI